MYIIQIAMKVIIYMHLYKFAVTQGIYMINLRLTFTSQGEKKKRRWIVWSYLHALKNSKKKKKQLRRTRINAILDILFHCEIATVSVGFICGEKVLLLCRSWTRLTQRFWHLHAAS